MDFQTNKVCCSSTSFRPTFILGQTIIRPKTGQSMLDLAERKVRLGLDEAYYEIFTDHLKLFLDCYCSSNIVLKLWLSL